MMLEQVKKITNLVQEEGGAIDFSDLCASFRDALGDVSVYVIARKGKVLGRALVGDFETTAFDADWLPSGYVPEALSATLAGVTSLTEGKAAAELVDEPGALIVPIVGSGRRLATLLVIKAGAQVTPDEVILAEFVATILGMVIAHAIDEEEEDEAEEKRMARSAVKSLSYSEILAVQHIFDALQGDEGLLVASRIADEAGITRSVIVNALRKLASANVIESRSLGMKGTYLRVLNREIRNELDRQRFPYTTGPAHMKKQA